MPAHQFASSVVALIVALFNGLLAGYVLASARGDTRRLLFACGPSGVALFATAWFVLLLDPGAQLSIRLAASLAALLAVSGFASDALMDLGPSRARRVLVSLFAPGSLALAAVAGAVASALGSSPFPSALLGLAMGAVGMLGVARLLLWNHGNAALRRLSRHVVTLVGASLVICALRTGLELLWGAPPGSGVILCIILAAEAVTLSYVLHDRVAAQLPIARAVTYAALAVLVTFAAVALSRWLGLPVDLAQVAVTVLVALLAAVVFLGFSEQLSRGIEFLLFPNQARLAGQVAASRAEAAALRGRLERAERLAIAGELAASVAHEVKNPLAAVRGYAELLADHAAHVPTERRASFEKAVRIIREESDRIDARIAELLSLGRAPRGERKQAPVDVSRVVLEVVAVAEGEPDFPTLVPTLDPSLRALGDEDELRGVLLNLLKNAAEAMRERPGGRIEVVARGEGGRVAIEVRDEGKGLDGVAQERLFQPFYTTKAGGTGLGLAIARSAIEAAGGKVGLAPRADGPGAVARVELPEAPKGNGPEEAR